jgi:hypothetical protein
MQRLITQQLDFLLSSLASQSSAEFGVENCDGVKRMKDIVVACTDIFREMYEKLPKQTIIVIMKIFTILKIICERDSEQMFKFRSYIVQSNFMVSMVEKYVSKQRKESKSLRTEVIIFITNFLNDMP